VRLAIHEVGHGGLCFERATPRCLTEISRNEALLEGDEILWEWEVSWSRIVYPLGTEMLARERDRRSQGAVAYRQGRRASECGMAFGDVWWTF
jgi:hypothetical protein